MTQMQTTYDVKVYTQPGCMRCKSAMKYLDRLGKSYNVINIDEDSDAKEYVKSQGFITLPVIQIEDGTVFSGFRPDMLKKY